ncbi:hypothetical protein [Flavobacterium caeni]|uniref:Tape measure domain-containing protein n=1 Tax=Flavobacterium caeni TaxID=490189 RepID=A0A1G5K2B6_9FLAO|nr:hypothetical protein [Flavobacterium caeni]SCY94753.1 hypothetical protein SAMN02927903_03051 [Flavobacterium caeni]
MNAYEFIIKMRDYASSSIRKLGDSVGATKTKVDGLDGSLHKVDSTTNMVGSSMGKLKNIIASVFAVATVFAFTNKVIDARSEYEKFNAVLTNTFQSDKVGAAALNMLTDFATKTPFQLNELTGSFIKLANRGFAPTRDEMTKLGDLASSQGKGFDQLTEAMLDAQTGEFERLKEFGINASKSGDKVMLSFKGVTKEVKNNSDAIGQALMQYGQMAGVSGSMEAISQTLGGQISNLEDQWWNFLVAVGGESGGIFNGVISLLSSGLAFLQEYLPVISDYFRVLWSTIQPVFGAINQLLGAIFGFHTAGDVLRTFGNIMTGLIMVIDFMVQGALSPMGKIVLGIAGVWLIWTKATWAYNAALAVYNALMAVNPITWVIIGVITLIGIIGMLSKYTSGWGESWHHTVNGAKFIWETYASFVKAQFNTVVQAVMIGIDKLKLGWYQFKEAVGIGNSAENQKMIAGINADVEARKKSIVDGYKKVAENAANAKKEFSQIGITVDTKGMSKDFNALKARFGSAGGTKDTSTTAYDDFLKNQQPATANAKGKEKEKKDGIVSGGSKITHITINIDKLQDDTKIFVSSTEQGLSNLGDKVQEILLRAVNSVNQMQTN